MEDGGSSGGGKGVETEGKVDLDQNNLIRNLPGRRGRGRWYRKWHAWVDVVVGSCQSLSCRIGPGAIRLRTRASAPFHRQTSLRHTHTHTHTHTHSPIIQQLPILFDFIFHFFFFFSILPFYFLFYFLQRIFFLLISFERLIRLFLEAS